MYDTLYQDWLKARQRKDYQEADRIRDEFERLHGLTIFSEGECPILGVTVERMSLHKWVSKYAPNNALLDAIAANNAIFGSKLMAYPRSTKKQVIAERLPA